MQDPRSKPTSDAERLAAQKAREYERRRRQAEQQRGRRYAEPIPLTRGEWGGVRASATKRVKVVR